MSFARDQIDPEHAQAVCRTPTKREAAPASVLVVCQTPSIGQAMAVEMAKDSDVTGRVVTGTLSQIVADDCQDWAGVQFVVFELSNDMHGDLAALGRLQAAVPIKMEFVAVSSRAVAPMDAQALTAAGVQELLTLKAETPAPASQNAQGKGKITVVLRARGGAGASTLAVNLAVASARQNGAGRTALIDLDIQNAAVSLMLDMPESSVAAGLVTGARVADADFLQSAMVRHDSGVDVLAAPDIFAPLTALGPETVQTLLGSLQARYDTIILDMPQGIVEWIEPVFAQAARVLLVSDTTLPSVKRTRRLLDLIQEDHMTLPVDVVINQHKRPVVMSASLRQVESLIAQPLRHWIPMDARALRRATDMGQPLQVVAKRAGVTRAIDQLATDLFATPEKG